MWHYRETGSGRPLILLHGIGMSYAAWNPVIPYLRASRRVIAFDIAGFGSTPPLPKGTLPTVSHLVDALAFSIREIGIEIPVDIAGSSLGGSMALEAARRGLARSAVAIAPPGLWKERPAPHVKYVFGGMRFMARHVPAVLKAAVRLPFLRQLTLAVPISIGSRRMPVSDAVRAVDDLMTARAFDETFENTRAPLAGAGIAVPVTVIFGDRDWILPKCSQLRTGLPAHATWVIKRGWGHVPMWVDPAGVAHLILDGTRSPADPRSSRWPAARRLR